jgi:hypothetical protein
MRQRKATPGEIARYAVEGGVWKVMEPYMSALTHGTGKRKNFHHRRYRFR